MLTQKQVLEAVKSGERESRCLDSRDFARLVDFFPVEEWKHFGFELKDGIEALPPTEWTLPNIFKQLSADLEFGFEKALSQRSISSALMFAVVKMWLWVLEDPLQDYDEDKGYRYYGLPLFKAVAEKYGFANPIGKDIGNEEKYSD